MSSENVQTKWGQFISLIIVFFFWGFVGSANDILIPVFKKVFTLSQVQSQLVAWAFYAAYFVGSIIFFLVSLKRDVLQKFGYKKTLSAGLILSAVGSFLFIPAASFGSFPFFLTALFIVGLGFSIQQIVANPLAIKMGNPSTGAHRLTLAGGVNSFGTTIGAILLGIALFGMGKDEGKKKDLKSIEIIQNDFTKLRNEIAENIKEISNDNIDSKEITQAASSSLTKQVGQIDLQLAEISKNLNNPSVSVKPFVKQYETIEKDVAKIQLPLEVVKSKLQLVKFPFTILGFAFIVVAIFMYFSKIEDPVKEDEEEIKVAHEKFNILDYPQLYLGMLGIFIYVGTEVTIISNLPALLKTSEFGSILEDSIAPFIALYWGSLMIGRWNGGVNVFNTSNLVNTALKFIVPALAFGVIIGANIFAAHDVSSFYIYPIWILLFIAVSFVGGKNAGKTLMLFGISGLLMMVAGLAYPNPEIAKFFFISGGLFLSIMWPSIFDLAIAGLAKNTGKASSFLIMMILGGGVIPLIQGSICDLDLTKPEGIFGITWTHFSYIVPLLGFAYLGFYGFYCPKILKRQGISHVESEGGGH
ncbi:MFS transporter [Flavobacterium soyae]|uniref:MFS transporter n=1 Tax=Flavobacterium soyae TaxID=2903098 RepID=UPI001E604CE0|nr:MFS transporter [Flavobacterium soyae]MCD9576601.1 MFS transporter [Flavobacterium soyae]